VKCFVIIRCVCHFGFFQVIPQAICSRYGLAVGANMVWLVNIVMVLCWPLAYPIGRVSLMNDAVNFEVFIQKG